MIGVKYNVIYLLGAGASAQRKGYDNKFYLPLANEFSSRIDHLLERGGVDFDNIFIELEESRTIRSLFEEFKLFIDTHNTIDEGMRLLYLKSLDDKKGYEIFLRYKRIISLFFFIYESYFGFRDTRYNQFILTLVDNVYSMPHNLHILSWNYDNQYEFSASGIAGQYMERIANVNFFKINGSAHFFDLPEGISKKDFEFKNHWFNVFYRNDMGGVKFAWEGDVIDGKTIISNKLNKYLESIKGDINFMVVIGYSFPYVNHPFDFKIINKLNPRKIYFQNPFGNETELNIRFGKKVFEKISETNRFYLPNELFMNFKGHALND